VDPSEEEIEYCTPPEIQDKAHDVSLNLLPEKSRGKYQLQYTYNYCSHVVFVLRRTVTCKPCR
jgi:hypothetical protein